MEKLKVMLGLALVWKRLIRIVKRKEFSGNQMESASEVKGSSAERSEYSHRRTLDVNEGSANLLPPGDLGESEEERKKRWILRAKMCSGISNDDDLIIDVSGSEEGSDEIAGL